MAREWIAEKLLQKLSEADSAGLSVRTLADAIGRAPDKTNDSLQTMVRRGLVQLHENPDGFWCRLTETGRIAASSAANVRTGAPGQPRQIRLEKNSLRARAWRALRMEGGKSTLGNLLHLILTGEERSPGTNLVRYFNALRKAGILTQSHRRARGNTPTSNGFVVWMIAEDVGPQAPIWQPTKNQVFDPNQNITYPLILQ